MQLLRRYPVAMVLNLAGLSVAFCAFAVIMGYVRYEESFDTFHPHHEDIFRVDQKEVDGVFRSVLPPGFADAVINGSSHVVAGTLYCPFLGEQYVVVRDSSGQEHGFIQEANNVTAGFFDVFGIKLIEGSRDALADPATLALPRSLAEKMFGNVHAVGKHIEIRSGSGFIKGTDWTVGAVFEDLPENSQIRNNILFPVPDGFMDNFSASNFICYLRLDDCSNAGPAADDFNRSFDFSSAPRLGKIELVPLEGLYYLEEGSDGRVFRSGSRSRTAILVVVALLILLAGTFNYTNFYTSLIPSMLRGINTEKVFGASLVSLRLSIMAETLLLSIAAWAVSAVPVYLFAGIGADPAVIAVSLGAVAVSGLLSGLYPAFYATSLQPAMVLKGRCGMPVQGRRMRNILLFVQLSISSALLVFVSHVWLQNRLMNVYDCGFDKDRIAVVNLTSDMVKSSGARFRDILLGNPEIEGVAYAMETVGGQDVYNTQEVEWRDGSFQCFQIWCTPELPEVLGIQVVDGTSFSSTSPYGVIFNKSVRDAYGLETGPLASMGTEVRGFCKDVRLNSLRGGSVPVCFTCVPEKAGFTPVAYVRFSENADRRKVASIVTSAVKGIDPVLPADVLFYDDILAELYGKERSFRKTVMLFSLVAVLLSLFGVFSMVMFDIQSRRRDTALRRVFGASSADVVAYGNRSYMSVSILSVLAGAPAGWIAVSFWLSNFAVRTGPSFWVFATVLVAVPLLVGAVVSVRILAAAGTNPAQVLGNE